MILLGARFSGRFNAAYDGQQRQQDCRGC
jgi:hypothetical protein